ncbi:MAG: replicative DNA helicase [Candidatus Vogelbacteria bacterium CG10_big_fil_rev_8_21_14_0_10_50_13]|uniref:Replicative DNA helicase n=1 Tax=Candidatus Vogelbacteria bacterium CG10_big_fil_rev_8_21_14_0_10_50_13 TaxID=1975044 RepID=A0A2H0RG43_9BACT|nr:MAG: replicative DNA helicase [Candidatus Vogelbacteria bacterium CG10_big_fil_rev_8_21_14_0_10_50_13]
MATDTKPLVKLGVRIPPQDLTAEQALLGAILIKPRGIPEVADMVAAEHFYAEKHRIIYQAMIELDKRGEPIDFITLTSYLKERQQLDEIGGGSYLAELVNLVPSANNLKRYGNIVAKKAALRRLIASAGDILDLGYNEEDDVDSIFERAEQLIHGLTNFSQRTYLAIKDTLSEAWERLDRLHKSTDELRGVPSGFRDIDNLLAGFQKSDLVILAARPSVGKTSLALDFIRHAACRLNVPTAIFSLEMSSQQLVDRLLAAEANVDSWKLRTGKIGSDEEFARIRDAMDNLAKAPIFIDDEPSNNIMKMRSVARRLKSEHNLGLIVVDYLQLMVPRRETDSMVQMVTEISRSLKGLARELEIPVIALSQLSRAVEQRGGKPRLSDLRDSGSIEQDADVVMFIHREDRTNEESDRKNVAEIMIEKHRNGPTGRCELYFDDKRTSFTTIEKSDFGSLS